LEEESCAHLSIVAGAVVLTVEYLELVTEIVQ
jgi:hypothetical protein